MIRPASARDVHAIYDVVRPYAHQRVLVAKDLVEYFESLEEFVVAEVEGEVVGCGALHVFSEAIAEIRTLAVRDEFRGRGIGKAIVDELEARARSLAIRRLFCLTFEVEFFSELGYVRINDDAAALARVKPNTLGNSRMFKQL
ncbi:hypothetical protein HMPREF3167_05505 [Trueperella sp. HMSC08B05]|uniref:GNAT family N-acetyltransferase n=1 Tax=Trueperella TaxID=1069494 RepID=UPI00083997DE|nr:MULTISPECIES: GNAT family N-acetyltransferase [Trueperella]OCW60704.1 hypothetical protein AKG36_03270 [Trueperella bernardiae]OFS67778.1 hypothetical protein HMPREF3174_02890 [Trueperella sp. HMSC08H06]OFS74409.1 hypothetical protein HMPREF3167_05505 [Trueperella sp. HMSC08B05]PKZ89417.1 GNAT family N-acetyltransferase [Trueperella bernardiae]WIM07530.1 GNAT family N-acetyltransferase [Trueperella bernardiae]